jgi:hypothetical protein
VTLRSQEPSHNYSLSLPAAKRKLGARPRRKSRDGAARLQPSSCSATPKPCEGEGARHTCSEAASGTESTRSEKKKGVTGTGGTCRI